MAGKNPINILHEIELDINDKIKTIDYILNKPAADNKDWYKLVQSMENQRSTARFEERKK